MGNIPQNILPNIGYCSEILLSIHCQKGKGTNIGGRKVGKITDIFPEVPMVFIDVLQQLLHTICMSHADTTEEAVERSHLKAIRSITPLQMAHK